MPAVVNAHGLKIVNDDDDDDDDDDNDGVDDDDDDLAGVSREEFEVVPYA